VPTTLILVLSHDVMTAALVGALVEASGMTALFPRVGEGEREALLRARPRAVLVDCDHPSACGPAFFGAAMMADARIVLYGSRDLDGDLPQLAKRHRATFVKIPVDADTFSKVLRGVVEQ